MSPAFLRSRRLLALGAAGAAALALSAPGAGAAVPAVSSPPGAGAVPTFSHGSIVDMQRSGFEPGIQVDGADRLYTSVPYGFSNTQSFLWSSEDHGNSYQLIPASVGTGKTQTCAGGGDSELALDAADNLFFSDLQGLTNLSNSVTKDHGRTFTAGCTSAPNTPVDRMWYAVHGKLGDSDFRIYEEYDAVASGTDPSNPLTNQLVETVSTDGVNFTPLLNANPTDPGCFGGGVANCVTSDEGIPGNQVLSADGKTLYIAHTDAESADNGVVVSVGTLSTNPSGAQQATWKNVRVNADICPKGSTGQRCGAALFATIAQDTAGGLYVVAASAPKDPNGVQTGPYQVYLWRSTDGGNTWGTAQQVSSDGSNAFPWITAGDPGRVDITYYHATEQSEGGKFAFDDLRKGSFTVELAQSLNALDASPQITRTTVSEHPVKYGPICTGGLGCTTSGGDRSLGDYLQVNHDANGAAVVAYVDDTSNAFATGNPAQGSQVAETGPGEIARQVGGASLFVSAGGGTGTVPGAGPGPGTPSDTVTDPTGDTFYSANGTKTPAGDNLDVTGATVADDPAGGLIVSMKIKSLASLAVNPAAGGNTGEWITRFTTFNGGATPGNGHILYAGMESVGGGAPTFFAGDTKRTRLFMTYQQEAPATGSYDPATGTITVRVPAASLPADLRAATSPARRTLYSATGFTATAAASLKGDPEGLFNLTDATTPFNHLIGAAALVIPGAPGGVATPPPGGGAAAPGSGSGLTLAASSRSVRFGNRLTLRGRLVAAGKPVPDTPVHLTGRRNDGRQIDLGDVRTDASGAYSKVFTPRYDATYTATGGGFTTGPVRSLTTLAFRHFRGVARRGVLDVRGSVTPGYALSRKRHEQVVVWLADRRGRKLRVLARTFTANQHGARGSTPGLNDFHLSLPLSAGKAYTIVVTVGTQPLNAGADGARFTVRA